MTQETYPSGRVVTNTVDDAGQLSKVSSQETSQTERTYAQNFVYNSAGAIERFRLGNSRWESYQYNNRLQVTQIGLGASVGDTSLLKLNFEYNTTGNHDNNGALLKQTITLPGTTTVLTQSYTYDALNRLQSATEMFGSSQSWKQTFDFDRFGNRTFNTSGSNTTTLPSSFSVDIYNPAISKANNRYSSTSYSYDAAGNVTANAAGQSFVYDAEQHQIEVRTTSTSALVASYQYDGSGQRVKKIVGTEETTFIYDAMGKSVAEYVLNSTTTPDVRTRYLTQDQLGSPRVITDGTGQVQERHDYLAYGEEAGSSLSTVRTTAQKYAGTSAVRKRYTGYERDDESGLDYAQARYYNNAHGRFTSVDPLTASATIKDPQTFNRYSYALNSPYKFTDPLGLYVCTGTEAECRAFEGARTGMNYLVEHMKDKNSADYQSLHRAIAAYGEAGEENGVEIVFGTNEDGKPMNTKIGIADGDAETGDGEKDVTAASPSGMRATVTVDLKQLGGLGGGLKVDNFAADIAHEGSHIADGAEILGGVPKKWADLEKGGYTKEAQEALSVSKNSQFESEFSAFQTSVAAGKVLGHNTYKVNKGSLSLWEPGWDNNRLRKAIGAYLSLPAPKGYGLTKGCNCPLILQ